MIIVKLMGGLGNQLFQFALGRKLSVGRQELLHFDPSEFESDLQREYELYY